MCTTSINRTIFTLFNLLWFFLYCVFIPFNIVGCWISMTMHTKLNSIGWHMLTFYTKWINWMLKRETTVANSPTIEQLNWTTKILEKWSNTSKFEMQLTRIVKRCRQITQAHQQHLVLWWKFSTPINRIVWSIYLVYIGFDIHSGYWVSIPFHWLLVLHQLTTQEYKKIEWIQIKIIEIDQMKCPLSKLGWIEFHIIILRLRRRAG